MLITILNISPIQKTTATGKPYEVLDIAYKNLTFQGKVEGKQLMPFGANAGGFNILKNAQSGQTYEITVVKNDKGYNDWTGAQVSDGSAAPAPQVYQPKAAAPGAPNPPARANTFETPIERAQRQVYIVRQSSLTAAINTLSIGAKSPLKTGDVIATAQEYEAYVLDIPKVKEDSMSTGFDDMDSDVPV